MGRSKLVVQLRVTAVASAPSRPATTTPVLPHPQPRPAAAPVKSPRQPAPSRPPRVAVTRAAPGGFTRHLPLLSILTVIGLVNLVGFTYYVAPIGERMRSPLHPWFKPSGYVGQTAGLIAFALFVFLYLYPLRKKLRHLAFLGSLSRWLDVHIVAGLAVPLLGAVHASWRFQGLIGLGYASMVLVSLSGIVGKYLYVHIPRGRSGLELSLLEIETRRRELLSSIVERTGLDADTIARCMELDRPTATREGLGSTLVRLVSSDLTRWRLTRRLRRLLRQESNGAVRLDRNTIRETVRLARREIALTQQLRTLQATQRVFRLWHVVHRPFSITAFVAVTIHVVLVVSLGVTWIW